MDVVDGLVVVVEPEAVEGGVEEPLRGIVVDACGGTVVLAVSPWDGPDDDPGPGEWPDPQAASTIDSVITVNNANTAERLRWLFSTRTPPSLHSLEGLAVPRHRPDSVRGSRIMATQDANRNAG